MLNILISLCLIFALFAGLVSSVNELVAQVLKMRGIVLFESIALLLGELPKQAGYKSLFGAILRKLRIRKPRLDKNALTLKVYGHPIIDTLSQPGSLPSYISASAFSAALVRTLSPDGTFAPLRQSLENRDSPFGRLFGPMLDEAGGNIEIFKNKVEAHFNLVMTRVEGWYKRRTQAAIGVIGFMLACSFNIDTIYIVKQLQNNPVLVTSLVKQAEKMSEIADNAYDPALKVQIRTQIENIDKQIDKFNSYGLPVGWNCPKEAGLKDIITSCNYLTNQNSNLSIFGYILTALAGMFGAPFWFDALSKLFAMRGTGRKPGMPAASSSDESQGKS